MNDEQYLSTLPVEYEESGPRYSESYLAKIGRYQKMCVNRNSGNFVSCSTELNDDDRSVIVAPSRDFVEEDDKEAENITIPDRLCQPESPTVICSMNNLESADGDFGSTFECAPIIERCNTCVQNITETLNTVKQSSEDKERVFGSLGPISKINSEVKESTTLHNRTRSQVSGWAKLLASTIQRSKSAACSDTSQKNFKSRPGRKSDQPMNSITSSNPSMIPHESDSIDTFVSKADMRKKKKSIGVDMREKLGFFRKQFQDTGSISTTSIVPSIKGGVANSGCMLQLERVWKATGGPPTKEKIISWSHSFEDLLFDRHGISLFLEFLRSEFSEENLEFWSECQSYRSIGCPKKLQEKATQIYEDYVAEQSPREINIDSVTRIQTALEIPHATVNTFDQSQKKIQALMEKDSYQRFLRSDIYHGLVTQLNAQPHLYCNVGQCNSVASVDQNATRVSYIPGLLPNVTAGIKTHPLHSSTNSRILSINIKESHKDDLVPDHSHHRSAPSSPKNITASTIP